jgi:hypothetical protein
MPIIKDGGQLYCKSNGVSTKEDDWKPVQPSWLRLNADSDTPRDRFKKKTPFRPKAL